MCLIFFRAKKKLAEEKYKRSIAEENEAKALLKYHLLKVELEKLKADVQQSQSRAPAGVHDRYTLLFIHQLSETGYLVSKLQYPANIIYLFKISNSNRNTRKWCEICSKLTKTPKLRH